MAINPNTNFSSGQVLTADQANRWPRGIMSYVEGTADQAISTTETTYLTAPAFTAVAGRYYRITYFEPAVGITAGAGNYTQLRIRQTNVTGTVVGLAQLQVSGATGVSQTTMAQRITTFSAGSITLVATMLANTGAPTCFRNATYPAFLMVEDLGPA